eukprot:scaffold132105_cov57-Phaeocystis_antarctica.AAC.2
MVTIAVRRTRGGGAASGDVVCPLWCRARSLGVLLGAASIMSDDYHPDRSDVLEFSELVTSASRRRIASATWSFDPE